jgi:hypothetical protein
MKLPKALCTEATERSPMAGEEENTSVLPAQIPTVVLTCSSYWPS